MKLSIIIPVFNEEKTIATVLKRVINLKIDKVAKEIIVVDDGSIDNTVREIKKITKGRKNLRFLEHAKNQGKGAAVKTGIKNSKGDYIIIQDADLEYNPNDISKLIKELDNSNKLVVFGTRLKRLPHFKKEERTGQFLLHYLGNRFLSLITSALYWKWITDMETCYKLFPRKAAQGIKLNAKGFEFEPEITSKLLKKGYRIKEVSITTNPRGYDEGKKINTLKDGSKAVWYLLKYRLVD